jgi:hypothetical protein
MDIEFAHLCDYALVSQDGKLRRDMRSLFEIVGIAA